MCWRQSIIPHISSYSDRISIEFLKWFFKSAKFADLLNKQVPGGIKTEIKPKHILPLRMKFPTLSNPNKDCQWVEPLFSYTNQNLIAKLSIKKPSLSNSSRQFYGRQFKASCQRIGGKKIPMSNPQASFGNASKKKSNASSPRRRYEKQNHYPPSRLKKSHLRFPKLGFGVIWEISQYTPWVKCWIRGRTRGN